MSMIPSNLTRVPNALLTRLSLGNITRTNLSLFEAMNQLSTGRAISRVSDDPVKAATIGVLNERLDRSDQVKRNLDHAKSNLNIVDSALGEANTVALEAKSIAQEQLSVTSSPDERRSQAVIVEQLIQSLFNTATRQGPAGYFFGGSITSAPPIVAFGSGYRYRGDGPGLITDIPVAGNVPITLSASNAIGALAARVKGTVDLDPGLRPQTRLADLAGARGLGVRTGVIEYSVSGGTHQRVDLSGADSIQDVVTRLTASIRQYESTNSTTVLGSTGITTAGEGFNVDVASGATVQFFDADNGSVARDLGLTDATPIAFQPGTSAGVGLGPRLTWDTPVSALAGITGPLGSIKLTNMGRSATIDLSTATTLEDLRNQIEGANLGVRVVINEAKNGIDVLNEVAAGRRDAMSIEEVSGSNYTATRLGIRSLHADTLLSDFNDARGVGIVDGSVNPTSGLADPSLDVDFRITLGDSARTTIDIDLRPQDIVSVRTLLARINDQAATQLAAAGLPTTSLTASLSDSANGIILSQDPGFTTPLEVQARNNSPAAENLGLLSGRYDPASASLIGEDRAKVRVDNLFTHLIDLREALLGNDTRGITFAGEGIESAITNLAESRGMVGGYAQRVDSATTREEDRNVVDQTLRSELQDADYAQVAGRVAQLQTQLQAALRITAQTQQTSLLDYL